MASSTGFGGLVVGMAVVAATWCCSGPIRAAAAERTIVQMAPAVASESAVPVASGQPDSMVEVEVDGQTAAEPERTEPAPGPERTQLRRMAGREMNRALVQQARRIINDNYRQPIGTLVPFEIEGQRYVGRIERHYHPEGGPLKPWGFHPGCSLFVVEPG